MQYYEVAPNHIVRSDQSTLTYSSESELAIGQIVRIEVGKKSMTGVIMKSTDRPDYDVKAISYILTDAVLPEAYMELAIWMSTYYRTPLATVLQTMLPRGLEKKRRIQHKASSLVHRDRTNFVFNGDQTAAISSVVSGDSGTYILHGITGSGKTAVYIELAKQTINSGKSVVVLVPEIALTSQLVAEFSAHFDDIIVTHSTLTEAERHTLWLNAINSHTPRIVIGPRSALFMPLRSIGLIVIDESHEPSYKQEQSPRYHASRVAHVLASYYGAKLVLGSATPLAQDFFLAQATKRPIITMKSLANTNAIKPTVNLIDMTKRSNFKRHRFLSDSLLKQLEADFASGKQALIFHNRRGSTSVTLCENCGWQAGCPRCLIPLTLHADIHELRCHICGLKSRVPTSCPECQNANIIHRGIGTKLIESELKKLFPDIRIARFDGDNNADDTVDKRYSDLYSGEIQLIIGTQVIAKGLDLPKLHTVGIVQADAGLSMPDYSSSERTFQLLAQAIGRVGRTEHATNVVAQSYQPSHPIVQYGLHQDYDGLYKRIISERKTANFPPYCYLLKLTCSYKTESAAIKNSKQLAQQLRQIMDDSVEILGPTPAFYERQRDSYRWQVVVKSPSRQKLLQALEHLPPKYWQFELDPISLLS